MTEKILADKHIRDHLESDYQQKFTEHKIAKEPTRKYQGLGLNWRDAVILMLALFFVGLYQVNAKEFCDLDDVDTGTMLAYNKEGNNYAVLNLISSDYEVNITGIVAEVKISQKFINDSDNWIQEGMYAFPVAHNAAVYQMKLKIGKRVIEGEIHEKQQAQAIYDQAVSEGLTASIVKQYRPNLFTTDVANIMPHEEIVVEISYQQSLTYDAGHIDFRLPLAIKSQYMQQRFLADLENPNDQNLQEVVASSGVVTDNKSRSIHINLEAGFELSEIKSLYHDVNIQQSSQLQTIDLTDGQLYDTDDFVLRWHPLQGKEPIAAMFSEKLNGEEYVLMMLLPPKNTLKMEQKREMVFIIDTSGSMMGDAMNAAKDALLFGLTQISSDDKFNVIEFNSFAKQLFTHSVVASADNIDQAVDFIDAFRADGGTNMGPALSLAMQDEIENEYLKQIIFITDGSVGNEAQLFKQINNEITQARLFTVAIGSAPNNYFMNKAALIGKGSYTNISNLNDVDVSMNELFVKLSSPALTDVVIDWNTDVEQNPRVIPDLYTDQPIIVTAKMQDNDPNVVLSGYANKTTWSVPFSLRKDGHSQGIAKLWARNQIDDLTDDYMLGAYTQEFDADVIKQEITDLALKYHLVSEFTSLVAVDKTPDMSRLVQLQARALNQEKVVAQAVFPQTALGWRLQLLIGLLLLMVAFAMRKDETTC